MKELKAFIFDLDGVITDTAEYHYTAWRALGEELGISFNREFNEKLKGISRMESLEKILRYGGREKDFTKEEKIALAKKKNENYKNLIRAITPRDILPGIKDLLKDIRNRNIKIALASASKNAPAIIASLELKGCIDYIVDPGEVKRGKPAPDIFLKAARALEVEPDFCVALEDAQAGIEAIKGAGMFAVGVGEVQSMEGADLIVQNTGDLSFKKIRDEFNKVKNS